MGSQCIIGREYYKEKKRKKKLLFLRSDTVNGIYLVVQIAEIVLVHKMSNTQNENELCSHYLDAKCNKVT